MSKETAEYTFNFPAPAELPTTYIAQIEAMTELVGNATYALADHKRDTAPAEVVRNMMLVSMSADQILHAFKATYNVDLDAIKTAIVKGECKDCPDAPKFLSREDD